MTHNDCMAWTAWRDLWWIKTTLSKRFWWAKSNYVRHLENIKHQKSEGMEWSRARRSINQNLWNKEIPDGCVDGSALEWSNHKWNRALFELAIIEHINKWMNNLALQEASDHILQMIGQHFGSTIAFTFDFWRQAFPPKPIFMSICAP